MFLLDYTDVSKKEILDECVIGFSGNKVKLIPVSSEEYQEHLEKTKKKEKKNEEKEELKSKVLVEKGKTDLYYYIGEHLKMDKKTLKLKEVSVFFNHTTEEFEVKKMSVMKESKGFFNKTHYESVISRFDPEVFKGKIKKVIYNKVNNDKVGIDDCILYNHTYYSSSQFGEYSIIKNFRYHRLPQEITKEIPNYKSREVRCHIEIETTDGKVENILDFLGIR